MINKLFNDNRDPGIEKLIPGFSSVIKQAGSRDLKNPSIYVYEYVKLWLFFMYIINRIYLEQLTDQPIRCMYINNSMNSVKQFYIWYLYQYRPF